MNDFLDRLDDTSRYDSSCEATAGPHSPCSRCSSMTPDDVCSECVEALGDADEKRVNLDMSIATPAFDSHTVQKESK